MGISGSVFYSLFCPLLGICLVSDLVAPQGFHLAAQPGAAVTSGLLKVLFSFF